VRSAHHSHDSLSIELSTERANQRDDPVDHERDHRDKRERGGAQVGAGEQQPLDDLREALVRGAA